MKKILFATVCFLPMAVPAVARAADPVPTPLHSTTVDKVILDTVARALPESTAVGAEFLNPDYNPNLYFTEDAQTSVTFVSEGAGYRNSLGYFTFEQGSFDGLTHGDIDSNGSGIVSVQELSSVSGVTDMGIIFGNASGAGGFAGSGGTLQTGDTFVLGGGSLNTDNGDWQLSGGTVFEEGTGMGFFVMANAWDGRRVQGWDTSQEISTYYSVDFLNPENSASATMDDTSGAARHVAMLNVAEEDQLILGFEDLLRPYGDNDFNDAVFIVRTTPEGAYDTDILPTVSAAPTPGIGVAGMLAVLVGAGLARHRTKKV